MCLALLPHALQHLLSWHRIHQDGVGVLHLEQAEVHHERGESLTGTCRRGQDDVQRHRQLALRLHGFCDGGEVRIELLQEVVLVLVHTCYPARLRAALVGPQVHGGEGLVLDAVATLRPHNRRRFGLYRVGAMLQGLAAQKEMVGSLGVKHGGDPPQRVLAVLSHSFDFVQHGLGPQGRQAFLLGFVAGSGLVLRGKAFLGKCLPHVSFLPLHVEELKHLALEQSRRINQSAVPGGDLTHDAETGTAANFRDEVRVVNVRPIMAREAGTDVHVQRGLVGIHLGIHVAPGVRIIVREVVVAHVQKRGKLSLFCSRLV
mmetsp:Transcript_34285/g.54938  ORF Transcript_34285/g.54938 Transcript_34285/m.54938 type:complete len:316 (-) Transcript_34285:176-1123(-)